MNVENRVFSSITCDLIPVSLDIYKSSEQDVKKFATEVSQYIFNPVNNGETLLDFKSGAFKNYINNLRHQSKRNSVSPKHISYFSTIVKSLKECDIPIEEVLFRSSPDEFWVITKSYSEKESNEFYNFVFANWKNIISDCYVLFIGEDQLNREQMPSDLISIICNE